MALARLILVTGKGGTGRSAVAAALALWLARRRPTMLVDLDQRMWAARMLGIAPRDDTTTISDLETMTLSAATELEAFIERLVPMKAIARRMLQSRTFGHVTVALPGLEAFLMLERLRLIAGRAALEDRYAVVDAPATGSALELLAVPGALKQIAPLGTLNRLAANVESFVADAARFSVMLTLTPQEMALREALEASDVLRGRLGVNVAAAALNCVPSVLFAPSDLQALGGPSADPGFARLAQWRDGAGRFAARARREASRAGLGVVELPMLFSPALGRAELEDLSRAFDTGAFAAAPRTLPRQPQAPQAPVHAVKSAPARRSSRRSHAIKPPAKPPAKPR